MATKKITTVKEFEAILKTCKPESRLMISVDVGDDGFPVTYADIRIGVKTKKPILTLHHEERYSNTLTVKDMLESIHAWIDNNERYKDLLDRDDSATILHVEPHVFHLTSYMDLSGTNTVIRLNAYPIEG